MFFSFCLYIIYNIFTITNPESTSFLNIIKSLSSLNAFVVNFDLMTALHLKAILPRALLSLSHKIFLKPFHETTRMSHLFSAITFQCYTVVSFFFTCEILALAKIDGSILLNTKKLRFSERKLGFFVIQFNWGHWFRNSKKKLVFLMASW